MRAIGRARMPRDPSGLDSGAPVPRFDGIPAQGLAFLDDLEAHNERAWFRANHATYRTALREPMLALAAALNERLEGFAPAYVTPPRRAVTAIHRDPRFAREGTALYKSWLALAFRRPGGSLGHAASFYVAVSPSEVRIRCGLPVPAPHATRALRAHIVAYHAELRALLRRQGIKNAFDGVHGARLRRLPADMPADHPAPSLLLYKSLFAEVVLDPSVALGRPLVAEVVRRFRAATPLVRFIDAALLDAPPATAPGER